MTDLSPRAPHGKRPRLVAAARDLVHRHGVEKTTLADIALAADVPVGNVYYYFKTKDDLIEAAIGSMVGDIEVMLASLETHRTPRARLKGLINVLCENADLAARYGCPMGTLCSELHKRDDSLKETSARLMQVPLEWMETQFRAMGRRDADELAMALMAAYEGVALLANTFRDPKIMMRESRRLARWIDSLS